MRHAYKIYRISKLGLLTKRTKKKAALSWRFAKAAEKEVSKGKR